MARIQAYYNEASGMEYNIENVIKIFDIVYNGTCEVHIVCDLSYRTTETNVIAKRMLTTSKPTDLREKNFNPLKRHGTDL